MKKILIGMVLITSIYAIGCSENIVLEENVMESKQEVKEVKVNEIEIGLNEDFVPLICEDNKVIGFNFQNEENDYKQTYSIDKNGVLNLDEGNEIIKTSFNDNSTIYNYIGVSKVYDTKEEELENKEYYYKDSINDILIRLDGFDKLTKKYRDSSRYEFDIEKIANNENYLSITFTKQDIDNKSGYYKIDNGEQLLIILDIENKIMYYKKDTNENLDECVYSMYYDKELESIMAITYSGKIKEVKLKKSGIILKEYSKMNLQGYEINKFIGVKSSNKWENENLVIALENQDDTNELYHGIYNVKSQEITILDKDIESIKILGKNNLINIIYMGEAYLGKINADKTIEYIYKYSSENEICFNIFGEINEDEDTIFIMRYMDKEGKSICKYNFIELE